MMTSKSDAGVEWGVYCPRDGIKGYFKALELSAVFRGLTNGE
jgi:hypothetical protein